MTVSIIQPTFSRGEVGPELAARTDLAAYQTALAKCINFIVSPYGGVMNRPGTQYLGATPANEVARMIRFKFNSSDTYALEFTHLKMRVIRNGNYVAREIVTNGNFDSGVAGWTVLSGAATWDAVKKSARLSTVAGAAGRIFQVMNNLVPGQSYSVTLRTEGDTNGALRVGNAPNNGALLDQILGLGLATYSFTATAESHHITVTNNGGTAPLGDMWVDAIYVSGPVSGGPPFEIVTPFTRGQIFQINFTQSADVMDMVHPAHKPQKLRRFNHDYWTLEPVSLVPSLAAPASATATVVAGGSSAVTQDWKYQITAVIDDGAQVFEESLPVTSNTITLKSDRLNANVTWPSVAGATYYNVYKDNAGAGIYGFIGRANTTSFADNNVIPTKTDTPPTGADPFVGAGNYPRAVGYFQQRLCYASTDNKPQTLWFSRTGVFSNFGYSFPTKDDDAITWTIASNEVNRIMHLTPLRSLMTFTDGAEWIIQGQSSGFTPKTINGDAQTYNGTGPLRPLVLNNVAIYAQERGRTVTAFGYTLEADGFSGNDISVLSPQMLQEFSLVDWDYQQIPYGVIWGAREDGQMVGITYLPEQQVIGWHRHVTDGKVLSICAVPEGRQDALYMCVERMVGGEPVRYIERMAERQLPRFGGKSIIADAWFLDCALRYDGRNTGSATMTLTDGDEWKGPELLTLTCSNSSQFSAGDVGDAVHYQPTPIDNPLRLKIVEFVSGGVVTVRPVGVVPEAIRGVPFTGWAMARDTLSGLDHLEGRTVQALADGEVVSGLVVNDGSISLDFPAGVVLVGLPYESELQTLEVTMPGQETMTDKRKIIKGVAAVLLETRGGLYGNEKEMWEFKPRQDADDYGAIQPITGAVSQLITDGWSGNGQLTVVQRDPLPMNILALIPRTDVGGQV
jgi:hypothetical protein